MTGPPPVRRPARPGPGRLAFAGVLLAAGAAAVFVRQHDVTSVVVREPVTRVVVEAGDGGVRINRAGGGAVVVTRSAEYLALPPEVGVRLEGTTLRVSTSCLFPPVCTASLAVSVPPDLEVSVSGGTGKVVVEERSGTTEVATTTGAIEVVRPAGPVRAASVDGAVTLVAATGPVLVTTERGAVTGYDLGAGTAEVTTGSGSIDLRFVAPVDSVVAGSGTGAVTLAVPRDAYRVDASAGAAVQVPVDAAAARTVVARSAGPVTVSAS